MSDTMSDTSSDDTARGTGAACPSCGVTVSAGYPKCPKCHTAMPNAAQQNRAGYAREGNVAGGTALESSSAMAWLAGAVALLLIGGGTIYFMARGDGAKDKARAAKGAPVVVPPKAFVPRQAGGGTAGESGPPDASTAKSLASKRSAASDSLRDALNADRLWTELEYAPGEASTLILRTAYCADPKLRAVVDKVNPALRGAEVRKLRCQARHGSVVFELDL